jgi:hypothetical protein
MNAFCRHLLSLYNISKGIYDDGGLPSSWADVLRDLEVSASEGKTEVWFSENRQAAREVAEACGLDWDNSKEEVQFVKIILPTK